MERASLGIKDGGDAPASSLLAPPLSCPPPLQSPPSPQAVVWAAHLSGPQLRNEDAKDADEDEKINLQESERGG